MKKLAIVTSHPIQYNAPIFKLLAERGNISIKVFYTWEQSKKGAVYDEGFGKKLEWDIPLLEGYEHTFVKNTSPNPSPIGFNGIINPTLIEEIRQWNSDAVLIYGWSNKSHLKCIRYFSKKLPVLFRGDSTLLNEKRGLKRLLRRMFLKWVYSRVDYSLFVGTNNKQYYLRHGMKEKQLITAAHAIDNNRFSTDFSADALQWRRKLGIQEDDVVFLYAGKLEPVKSVELLLGAFAEINSTNSHLIIVGNGILEKELKEAYAHLANVHFEEFQNQSKMPLVYSLCDVFVLPSKSETWGLAINEALACKKAVLVSDKCGAAVDLVSDGKNGFIFGSEDKEQLKSYINRLKENKNKLKEMGDYSYKIISKYTFENICYQIENLLLNKLD